MRQKRLRPISTLTLIGLALLSTPAFAFAVPLPEPETMILMGAGVAAALIVGKFRGRK